MTDEYISREAALEITTRTCGDYAAAFAEIRKLPAADVVEVVRCKDYKHRTEYGNCGHPRQKGVLPSAYPFDFCSYGEPKEDNKCDMVWM